jgi:hypothetical protein
MTQAKEVKSGEMIHKIFKIDTVGIEGDPNDDSSPLVFTITTDAVDRDRDIVDPSGILVENFKTNPVMQWAHNYDEFPVGKSVSMWGQKIKTVKDGKQVEQNGIKAAVVFQPDSNYHESYAGIRGSMVRRMYLTGFLNAVSIGFDPRKWEAIEEKDFESLLKTNPDIMDLFDEMVGMGTKFTSWEMLEFSAVPVPANPQALIDRGAKFGVDKSMVKRMLKAWNPEAIKFCTDGECAKGVIAYKKTGKAPDDVAWSGPSEVSAASVDDLKVMCTWFDDANPEIKTSYKLPHHTQAGKLLVKAGLIGCGNAIQGARGGVDIPDSDMAGVKSHLAKHYAEFDMTPPWEPKAAGYEPEEGKGMDVEKVESLEKRIADLEATIKAGRVLSAPNESDLRDAVAAHNKGVGLTNGVLDQVTGKPGATPTPQEDVGKPGDEEKPTLGVMPTQVVIKYPLGHDAPEVIEVHEEPVTTVVEPEVVESDDDIIVVDEDDLLRVFNGIGDDEELPPELQEVEADVELSQSQRENGETIDEEV